MKTLVVVEIGLVVWESTFWVLAALVLRFLLVIMLLELMVVLWLVMIWIIGVEMFLLVFWPMDQHQRKVFLHPECHLSRHGIWTRHQPLGF